MGLQFGAISSLLVAYFVCGASAITYSFPDCTAAPLKGNAVCDTSKDATTRAQAIISLFTVDELINNTVNLSPGVPRLGLPSYQWWSEALHGVASSPGVTFAPGGQNFSFATSFPQPILMGAAFDDDLIKEVATTISTEARAFNNFGRAGIDFFTPNINPFKDPRWGRGQETPGEDPFHISQYVFNLVQGLQGGLDPKPYFKVIADCKHFAAYDLENWNGNNRMSFNAIVTPQDMSEFYLPPFQSCVRDAKVASIMCSYNSVNGIPSCANSFLLQSILRDYWGFNDDGRWVTSDCDAVDNIFSTHHYTADYPHAVADALLAGTDVDCGTAYSLHLPAAFNQSLITRADLEKALVRQYSSLVRLGYFDSPSVQPFRQLGWSDVNTPSAQALAHQAAAEGIVLLKNDGTLPLKSSIKKIAFIGPWANATTQMQGNYQGIAPFLISPVQGVINAGFSATYTLGTSMTGMTTTGFAAALAAASAADAIVFAGGIDDTVESEGNDRVNITWPGVQLDLVSQLGALGKPFIVMQFGGGQVDGTSLKNNTQVESVIDFGKCDVNSILWAGYPGQSGGSALADILTGKVAPAGRLPTTQYPAEYTSEVGMTDMTLRPSSTNPGRTYKWFQGTPVFEFGHGLHFTKFALSWQHQPPAKYQIPKVSFSSKKDVDLNVFDTFNVVVKNTGKLISDYVALLFISGSGGPSPFPNKQLVSYTRLHQIKAGGQDTAVLKVTLGSIARADAQGNLWVYSGSYKLTVDTGSEVSLTHEFELEGESVQISSWPQDSS
ncbi:glycoside hydrolase family 3 protein [Flammula alnicola]|nr:glycoside hydrolase family 3 protein [Flammula alnicola]